MGGVRRLLGCRGVQGCRAAEWGWAGMRLRRAEPAPQAAASAGAHPGPAPHACHRRPRRPRRRCCPSGLPCWARCTWWAWTSTTMRCGQRSRMWTSTTSRCRCAQCRHQSRRVPSACRCRCRRRCGPAREVDQPLWQCVGRGGTMTRRRCGGRVGCAAAGRAGEQWLRCGRTPVLASRLRSAPASGCAPSHSILGAVHPCPLALPCPQIDFVRCDVRTVAAQARLKADTVIMNPPFGTRRKGAWRWHGWEPAREPAPGWAGSGAGRTPQAAARLGWGAAWRLRPACAADLAPPPLIPRRNTCAPTAWLPPRRRGCRVPARRLPPVAQLRLQPAQVVHARLHPAAGGARAARALGCGHGSGAKGCRCCPCCRLLLLRRAAAGLSPRRRRLPTLRPPVPAQPRCWRSCGTTCRPPTSSTSEGGLA